MNEEQLMAGDSESKRILVVEDNPDVREALAALLRDEGHRVSEAANGREALAFLRRHPETDLILLDLLLPVMDGWEFRKEQILDPHLAGIPVAVLSAALPDDPRAQNVFFPRYFPKPLHLRLLLDYVSTVRRLDLSGLTSDS